MAIVIIVVLSLFILFFITVTVANSWRIISVNRYMAANSGIIEAKITKSVADEKYVTILTDFKSPNSLINFNKRFALSRKNHKPDDYAVDKTVRLLYPKMDENKKVLYFPLVLEEDKPHFNYTFLFGSLALIAASVGLLVVTISYLIQNDAFHKSINEVINLFNFYTLILVSFGYIIAVQAMVTLLFTPNRDSLYDYLKVYGIKATARVKTYKYGRSKDANGNKECYLQIEYTTSTGEKMETRLNSFLYFQSQDEFIDILYAPSDSRSVVYLRK